MADLIADLWLPALVAAVLVFLASWFMHMFLPHHKSDFGRIPDEDGFLSSARAAGVKTGQYAFPYMDSPDALRNPAYREQCEEGPVGILVVGPNAPPHMGRMLAQHFVYCLVLSFMAGYVAHATLGAGADYITVFRVTGVAAWLAYSAAHASASIWYYQSWSMTWKYVADGLVYGLITAGAFGWLWPAA